MFLLKKEKIEKRKVIINITNEAIMTQSYYV